jgi:hypothetical protein
MTPVQHLPSFVKTYIADTEKSNVRPDAMVAILLVPEIQFVNMLRRRPSIIQIY